MVTPGPGVYGVTLYCDALFMMSPFRLWEFLSKLCPKVSEDQIKKVFAEKEVGFRSKSRTEKTKKKIFAKNPVGFRSECKRRLNQLK